MKCLPKKGSSRPVQKMDTFLLSMHHSQPLFESKFQMSILNTFFLNYKIGGTHLQHQILIPDFKWPYAYQRWARMAFWLQYQDQESWNSLKISISKSRLLKLAKNIQNQYQNSWNFFEEFNINIKIFEMSAAESISISRFLKFVKNFKTKINFIEMVLENSISK